MEPTSAEDYTNFGRSCRRPDPELRTILRFDRTAIDRQNRQFLTRFVALARPYRPTPELSKVETRAKERASWLRRGRKSFANHARFDPLFHFFAIPVFGISVIVIVVHYIMCPSLRAGWIFVVSVAALVSVFKIRVYALRNQDRTIRLEERLRLMTLPTEPLRSRIPELTESQLIAIRFACDAEVPIWVESALASKLSRADIKKAIQSWRPDYWRI